jgi:hypothetical protein
VPRKAPASTGTSSRSACFSDLLRSSAPTGARTSQFNNPATQRVRKINSWSLTPGRFAFSTGRASARIRSNLRLSRSHPCGGSAPPARRRQPHPTLKGRLEQPERCPTSRSRSRSPLACPTSSRPITRSSTKRPRPWTEPDSSCRRISPVQNASPESERQNASCPHNPEKSRVQKRTRLRSSRTLSTTESAAHTPRHVAPTRGSRG